MSWFASLVSSRALARPHTGQPPRPAPSLALALLCALALPSPSARAQSPADPASTLGDAAAAHARARSFLAGRATPQRSSPAAALSTAQSEHDLLLTRQSIRPHTTASLSAPWQPLGPGSVVSARYGKLTGRITAIALDPNDTSGNTAYLGTTGGGVWKSTNAAGPLASASFVPLTDTLPVFSASAGSSTIPSLSIGALAVQPAPNPVVLAGTGDPNDSTDSLYGQGLLRSTDAGLTWTLVTGSKDGTAGNHSFIGLSTAGIAFSTANPSLVVAALSTSPQSAIVDAATVASIPGLFYSADSGLTWHMSTLYDGAQVVQQPQSVGTGGIGNPATSVVWNPQRGRFFAAVRSHGYYSSADGITWTRLSAQPGPNLSSANCPVGANGQGSANCPIFRGALAVQPSTGDLYALTVDFADLDQGLWQDLCAAGSNGACASNTPAWANRLDNAALEVGSGSTAIAQGDYDLALAAAPTPSGGTLLLAGTVDLFRCVLAPGSASCSLRNTTNSLNGCNAPAAVAPAQHAIAATLTGAGTPLVLLGNDGGLWRSLDGVAQTGPPCASSDSQHFDNLNAAIGSGGSLAEIVGFAQGNSSDPAAADTLLVGLGSNGSAATASASSFNPWPQLSSGEGGFPLLDPTNPSTWILAVGAGVNLKPCPNGASCTSTDFLPPATVGEPEVSNDTALLDPPSLLDPLQPSNVLLGTCRVWRGPISSGSTWSSANAISRAFDGSATPCTSNSSMVRSVAAGGPLAPSGNPQNAGSSVLYAGMAGLLDGGGSVPGHLFVTTAGASASPSTVWLDASLSSVTNDLSTSHQFNPDGFDISSIAVDPHDTTGATVYASVMGFGSVPHLYRSTDFGSHWTRISANLPSAPANAVVVDPNDANTVYVALDTGVYVTDAVTTCASGNCWSVLGTGLPNAPVTTLQAGTAIPTGDGRRGMLRAGTYGRGLWQTPLLTAIGTTQAAITLSAASLTFGPQQVASESDAQVLTVTSTGTAPVTLGTPVIAGDFVESDTCAGHTVAVGSSCTISVRFAPTQTGARSGQLTVYANIPGGQATVSLSGSATAPASVILTPLNLSFPSTVVNQTAASQIVTVANTGDNPATISSKSVTGDFSIAASTCGPTLLPQTACSLAISFTPSTNGVRSGTLTVVDSVGTQVAQLSGTGNSP
ncbi:MAG TPA: choice-of-anchor D domain-containing protein, partial [Acidobacteriaceae bacterium]|nr:choice-of-anchor D domain-containing protein [Acidobacteriaceae bacterium]